MTFLKIRPNTEENTPRELMAVRCELPDARCGVGAPVLRGRSRAAAARAAAARAAAARAAAARAAASARAATRRCTPSQACGGVLFGFAAEPPGGSARSRGGGAEVLSAAMSRRARPGGEAGGPRRSQLGCRRRARRRTALLEMGVPPIEQHGGGRRCSAHRAEYPRIREFACSRAPPRAPTWPGVSS